MGDVVRRRLEALVAEIAPQRLEVDPHRSPEPSHLEPPPPDPEPPQPGPGRAAGPRAGGTAVDVLRRGWEFGRAHLTVVAILGLVGVAWALLGLSQTRTVPVVAAALPVSASSPSPTPTPEPIQVHVVGGVAHPGVVRLTVGSRVADALLAAGGALPEARLGELNLAAVVADGAQVVVGTPGNPTSAVREGGSAGGTGGPGSSTSQVNLNTATLEQLDTLPGVGPVTAQKILAWRTEHKRFTRVEELQEVDGIGPKSYAELRPHVRV